MKVLVRTTDLLVLKGVTCKNNFVFSAIKPTVLLELGITFVINSTLELPTLAYQKQDAIQIAVEDRVASKLYVYFDMVADKINSVHKSGGKVLIYCRAGMSRYSFVYIPIEFSST